MLREKVKFLACETARKCAVLALIASAWLGSFADEFNDGVNRDDPNFVSASLLIMGPGNELFSCVGHAAIRLECPHFKLDNCFSYESERAVSHLPAFLAGRLKMGLFRVNTEEFLSEYRKDGRGIRQYALNLPPKVKQRLWKHMDELVAEGANLPYDYMKRGCAKSVLESIKVAFAPQKMEGPLLTITQRETFHVELGETHPWNLFFLNAIVGTETDTFTEVVTPKNLLAYLRRVQVNGVPIVTGEGRELLPQTLKFPRVLISPCVVAWGILALTGLLWLRGWGECGHAGRVTLPGGVLAMVQRGLTVGLLAVQALAGCFLVYLVTASYLPNSAWNWLLVPFNPVMPLVCPSLLGRFGGRASKLTGMCCLVCVLILLGWMSFMLFSPHPLTDLAYVVLAGAYALVFAAEFRSRRWPSCAPCRMGTGVGESLKKEE